MRSAAVHQPNFLPQLPYFLKMAEADVMVLYDSAQFTPRSYISRTGIFDNGQQRWLSVPVLDAGRVPIADIKLMDDHRTRRKLVGSLERSYPRKSHRLEVFEEICGVLESPAESLADFNISLLEVVRRHLGVNNPMLRSSSMACEATVEEDPTLRLARITREAGATTYLSGEGGRKYQSEEAFRAQGVTLRYVSGRLQPWSQGSAPFVPGLSVVDFIFRHTPEEARELFWSFLPKQPPRHEVGD